MKNRECLSEGRTLCNLFFQYFLNTELPRAQYFSPLTLHIFTVRDSRIWLCWTICHTREILNGICLYWLRKLRGNSSVLLCFFFVLFNFFISKQSIRLCLSLSMYTCIYAYKYMKIYKQDEYCFRKKDDGCFSLPSCWFTSIQTHTYIHPVKSRFYLSCRATPGQTQD